jgi:hypothetical protein
MGLLYLCVLHRRTVRSYAGATDFTYFEKEINATPGPIFKSTTATPRFSVTNLFAF